MIKHCTKIIAACAASFVVAGSVMAADVTVARTITANTTWSKDNTYFLEGYTFVTNNATLTIEPGTVIKGRVSTGAGAASLIITRGAKIMAEGTADEPIIFTSELDTLNGNLGYDQTGLWGGVILLGNASINSRANGQPAGTPAQDQVEGLSVTGAEVDYATFGGTNDADNSGVMKYVSIRHGGAVIGGDNEINGLTLGGVGSGTTLEYIEVFANKDDGFEFFGGTVNAKYLVASFGNDDCFDFDQGYRGSLQFLFSIQGDATSDRGDKALEWDGATSPLDATPKGVVMISNYTAIGIGPSTQPNGAAGRENTAVNIRDNVEAHLYNSVFWGFAKGIDIENDIGTPIPSIKNNLWFSHIEANNTADGLNARPTGDTDISAYYTNAANDNQIVAAGFNSLSASSYKALQAALDPRPASLESPIFTGSRTDLTGEFFTDVDYKGAFRGELWIAGWTKLAELGILTLNTDPLFGENPEEDPAADPSVTTSVVRNSASKPVNISTRGFVGTDLQVLTAGFVITGNQAQSVLIRVAGPALAVAPFNLPGTLAKAQISLFKASDPTTPVAVSRVVREQSIALSAELGAFPLTEGQQGDATLVAVLTPGVYTVQVSGVDGATGLAIVEVYELD